jgi:predicted phosphoribosyltransferase
MGHNLFDRSALRERTRVFGDRAEAGRILAELLGEFERTDARVFAIPAGGVPVARELARALRLPLDVAVVSKITLPWNTEVGYGAVAFDGTARLNHRLIERVGLTEAETERGLADTRRKVQRRQKALRGDTGPLPVRGHTVILVDDGLASGFTMRVAVEALRNLGAARVVIAIPTAPRATAESLAELADAIYCANLRSGASFAVADAYVHWSDVSEREAVELLHAGGA